MARIRLLADAPEGARNAVVDVSRTRARDLVNGGQAERVIEPRPAVERLHIPAARRSSR